MAGIIFIDRFDVNRKFVITGSKDYSYNMGAPPPIPVLHVKKSCAKYLIRHSGEKIRIYTDTLIKESTGVTLEGVIPGRRDEYILLSTHHDHWFSGFHDNIIGMIFLAMVAKHIRNSNLERSLLLASFTAEESGAPGFAGWYWTYGSRSYATDLITRGIEILAVVNVDMPGRNKICFSGTPEMRVYADKIAERLGYKELLKLEDDSPYMDSISFSTVGWPAASIHSLPYLQEIYHSDRDDIMAADWSVIMKTFEFYKELVRRLLQGEKLPYIEGIKNMYDTYAGLNPPSEILSILYKIYRATKTCGDRVVRLLYSRYYRAYMEVYQESPTIIRTALLPQLLLLSDIRELEKSLDDALNIPLRRYIIGYLEELPGISLVKLDTRTRTTKSTLMRTLREMLKLYTKKLINEIDELIGEACLEKE